MDTKPITSACGQHHLVKSGEIIPGMDGYSFFLCETDVVARLLFHPCEDLFLGVFYINDNGARWLDVMGTISKTRFLLVKHNTSTIKNEIIFKGFPSIYFP